MLGLKIDRLNIKVNTNGKKFECVISFEEGLNIIRAENSSGKSTCVNAIAYGLGLEAILGPSRKRPFPKSLYEEIFDTKKDQNPFFVSTSTVCLSVRNQRGQEARLTRDISGDDSKISVELDGGERVDYFLGTSGRVGSAVSERGFHYWLAEYIGWSLPRVVTFDGSEATLYLECIFPLFFVEQKRGWSEIQANVPTHYGLKNVRRVAAEFCLGIDSFEFEKKIVGYKNEIEKAEVEWNEVASAAVAAAEFNAVDVSIVSDISKHGANNNIVFYYLEGDAKISVSEKERALRNLLDGLEEDVISFSPDNDKFELQSSVLRNLRRDYEELSELSDVTTLSVRETEKKLATLKNDLNQYHQLRRLKNVGSDIEADLDTQKCPICESELYDTLGNRNVKRQPMTLEENIEFLKSQVEFFETVWKRGIKQLDSYRAKERLLKSRIDYETDKLKGMREDIDDVNGATKSFLREKILAETALKNAKKLSDIQISLRDRASKAYSKWVTNVDGLKLLKKQSDINNKGLVINKLQSIIRANLEAFHFNPSAISSISISHQTFRPEQEGYDIVAETSASDYIRIIWAYTLALMELAGKEKSIKHGGFVVFDEPRQHEASKLSFTSLIDKASGSIDYGGQVIFATSLDEKELSSVCRERKVNLICFDDYILTPVQDDE